MPLKLNVGLSKKVGQPDYGSLGASCHVEVELDSTLIQHDLDGFQRHVRNAFIACRQAVQDELARHNAAGTNGHGSPGQNVQAEHSANGHHDGNGHGNGHGNGRRRTPRKATSSQVRAIYAIADRQRLDVGQIVQERFQVAQAEDLSIAEASDLIDSLKGTANGHGAAR